jgi:hypothetical protein
MSGHSPWSEIKHKAVAARIAAARGELEQPPDRSCSECGRAWTDPSERWQTFLTVDDQPALFCPSCAEREFGA